MLPFDYLVAAQNGDDLLLEYREPQVIGYGDQLRGQLQLVNPADRKRS
jgi:hypothetical protein